MSSPERRSGYVSGVPEVRSPYNFSQSSNIGRPYVTRSPDVRQGNYLSSKSRSVSTAQCKERDIGLGEDWYRRKTRLETMDPVTRTYLRTDLPVWMTEPQKTSKGFEPIEVENFQTSANYREEEVLLGSEVRYQGRGRADTSRSTAQRISQALSSHFESEETIRPVSENTRNRIRNNFQDFKMNSRDNSVEISFIRSRAYTSSPDTSHNQALWQTYQPVSCDSGHTSSTSPEHPLFSLPRLSSGSRSGSAFRTFSTFDDGGSTIPAAVPVLASPKYVSLSDRLLTRFVNYNQPENVTAVLKSGTPTEFGKYSSETQTVTSEEHAAPLVSSDTRVRPISLSDIQLGRFGLYDQPANLAPTLKSDKLATFGKYSSEVQSKESVATPINSNPVRYISLTDRLLARFDKFDHPENVSHLLKSRTLTRCSNHSSAPNSLTNELSVSSEPYSPFERSVKCDLPELVTLSLEPGKHSGETHIFTDKGSTTTPIFSESTKHISFSDGPLERFSKSDHTEKAKAKLTLESENVTKIHECRNDTQILATKVSAKTQVSSDTVRPYITLSDSLARFVKFNQIENETRSLTSVMVTNRVNSPESQSSSVFQISTNRISVLSPDRDRYISASDSLLERSIRSDRPEPGSPTHTLVSISETTIRGETPDDYRDLLECQTTTEEVPESDDPEEVVLRKKTDIFQALDNSNQTMNYSREEDEQGKRLSRISEVSEDEGEGKASKRAACQQFAARAATRCFSSSRESLHVSSASEDGELENPVSIVDSIKSIDKSVNSFTSHLHHNRLTEKTVLKKDEEPLAPPGQLVLSTISPANSISSIPSLSYSVASKISEHYRSRINSSSEKPMVPTKSPTNEGYIDPFAQAEINESSESLFAISPEQIARPNHLPLHPKESSAEFCVCEFCDCEKPSQATSIGCDSLPPLSFEICKCTTNDIRKQRAKNGGIPILSPTKLINWGSTKARRKNKNKSFDDDKFQREDGKYGGKRSPFEPEKGIVASPTKLQSFRSPTARRKVNNKSIDKAEFSREDKKYGGQRDSSPFEEKTGRIQSPTKFMSFGSPKARRKEKNKSLGVVELPKGSKKDENDMVSSPFEAKPSRVPSPTKSMSFGSPNSRRKEKNKSLGKDESQRENKKDGVNRVRSPFQTFKSFLTPDRSKTLPTSLQRTTNCTKVERVRSRSPAKRMSRPAELMITPLKLMSSAVTMCVRDTETCMAKSAKPRPSCPVYIEPERIRSHRFREDGRHQHHEEDERIKTSPDSNLTCEEPDIAAYHCRQSFTYRPHTYTHDNNQQKVHRANKKCLTYYVTIFTGIRQEILSYDAKFA